MTNWPSARDGRRPRHGPSAPSTPAGAAGTLRRLAPWLAAFVAAWTLFVCAPRALAASTLPPPGDYVVDPAGSTVAFNVTNLAVLSVDGKFNTFSGKVTVGDSLASSHVEASAAVASIDTGSTRRDEHLRSLDFFNASQFPHMTFKSTMLAGTPDAFQMKGNLSIKGITREVVFAAHIADTGVVVADAKIDRTEFGVGSGSSTIKNEVKLHLQIRMRK
jgi:polyisoprenoid-binding protein YceI